MRDMMNKIAARTAYAPAAAVLDGTAQVSTVVDLQGFDSAVLLLVTGTLTDADAVWSVLLQESDDGVVFTDVADADLNGTELLAGFTFADDGETRKLGYNGNRRYLRATVDDTTANTGNLFLAGIWLLGNSARQPTQNPPM